VRLKSIDAVFACPLEAWDDETILDKQVNHKLLFIHCISPKANASVHIKYLLGRKFGVQMTVGCVDPRSVQLFCLHALQGILKFTNV